MLPVAPPVVYAELIVPDHVVPDRRAGPELPATGPPAPHPVALLGLGLANAASLVAGLALGWFIDDQLGTEPVFVLLGIISGILLGVLGTFVQVRRYLHD